MKTGCKTCSLNSGHLFFYSKFGTAVFILFGLSFAFMAVVDIGEIEIAYYERFINVWASGFFLWLIYRTVVKTPKNC